MADTADRELLKRLANEALRLLALEDGPITPPIEPPPPPPLAWIDFEPTDLSGLKEKEAGTSPA